MDAFHRAYFAPPIASLMAAFQEGYHFDMLAMLNLQRPPHLTCDVYPDAAYARLATVLDPWLDEYGLARLPRLFNFVPKMHVIMLLHATYSGRVDVVEWALTHGAVTPATMLLLIDVAAWKNRRSVLDYFRQHPHPSGWTCSSFAMVAAAREGHIDIVRFLHNQFPNVPSTEDAIDMAAEFGHLDVVRFLHADRSKTCTTRAMNKAARNGHLDVLQFLHAHRSEGCTEEAMEWACEHGHLDVARWLVEHRFWEEVTEKAFDMAAGNNHLAVVEFLHRLQALSTEKAMDVAAENGHLSMVQWLEDHRPLQGCTEEAMDKATANGHLDVVKWLHLHRSEDGTCAGFTAAAEGGFLDVVKWVAANRPDMVCTASALKAAAEQTRVDVVKWLLRQDHQAPNRVAVKAGMAGYLELIELLQQHHPKMVVVCDWEYAIKRGDLEVIEWMVNRGERDKSALDVAARYGHLDVVQWLHARSFPASRLAMDHACKYGHFQVLRWLHRHRKEGCSDEIAIHAINNGHFTIAMCLDQTGVEDMRTRGDLENAARSGDLTLVEFLHENAGEDMMSPINREAPIFGGHFPVVQFWHHHRPDEISGDYFDYAVVNGCLELAKWLVAHREVAVTNDTLHAAARNGDMAMFEWVLSLWNGDRQDERIANIAAAFGHVCVLLALLRAGFAVSGATMNGAARKAVLVALAARVTWTSEAVTSAARGGHVQVVRWLLVNGYQRCPTSAIDEAAGQGHLAMVAYLHKDMCPATGKTLLAAAVGGAVHVVKWLVAHGVLCTAEVTAWAKKHPTSAAATWLLAHQAALARAKKRKVSTARLRSRR